MALVEISYPVTGAPGTYQNIFPSQKPIFSEFERKDATIISIVSGTNGRVQMTASAAFSSIEVGQFVTWQTDGYSVRSSRVTNVVTATTIEVDEVFTSVNALNSFINYLENYFVEIRYIQPDSVSNDQDAILLIDDFSQVPNQKDGTISANISLPSDVLIPDFDIASGVNAGLSIEYKIQYRESYEGNRSGTWISPTVDQPILLVHGSLDLDASEFTDSVITKRYVKGYPLIYSLLYSGINDTGSNNFAITMTEYGIDQVSLGATVIENVLNLNGSYIIVVDPADINSATRFIQFSYVKSVFTGQYDTSQYDGAQYA